MLGHPMARDFPGESPRPMHSTCGHNPEAARSDDGEQPLGPTQSRASGPSGEILVLSYSV